MNIGEMTIETPLRTLVKLVVEADKSSGMEKTIKVLGADYVASCAEVKDLKDKLAHISAERIEFLRNWRDVIGIIKRYQSALNTIATSSKRMTRDKLVAFAASEFEGMRSDCAKLDAFNISNERTKELFEGLEQ